MGDSFNLSGDFRGAVLNIKSTLREVQQSVGQIPSADASQVEELQNLIGLLTEALEKIPADKQEEADAVAEAAKQLIETAKSGSPNKTVVKITAETLKQAAKNLAEVAPAVIGLASQIVMGVLKITSSIP